MPDKDEEESTLNKAGNLMGSLLKVPKHEIKHPGVEPEESEKADKDKD